MKANTDKINERLEFLKERIEIDRKEVEDLISRKIELDRVVSQARLAKLLNEPLKSIVDMDFDDKFEYLRDIGLAHGIKHTIYSVYEHELYEVAVTGKKTIIGHGWDETYSVEVENPTWLDVWKLSDKMVDKVNDHHHVFLEGLYEDGDNLIFSMGS